MYKTRLAAAAAAVLATTVIGGPAMGGPTGPCVLNNGFAMETISPDLTGHVLVEVDFTWDGVSTKTPGCDGPVTRLHTRNTGVLTAWALLPDKKKAPLWVQIDPGADITVTSPGQLNNLGLSNASDVRSTQVVWTNPAG